MLVLGLISIHEQIPRIARYGNAPLSRSFAHAGEFFSRQVNGYARGAVFSWLILRLFAGKFQQALLGLGAGGSNGIAAGADSGTAGFAGAAGVGGRRGRSKYWRLKAGPLFEKRRFVILEEPCPDGPLAAGENQHVVGTHAAGFIDGN